MQPWQGFYCARRQHLCLYWDGKVQEDSLLPQTCKCNGIMNEYKLTAIQSGVYFGIGGLLLVLGGIGEWILGK